jgi:hypothetical protein
MLSLLGLVGGYTIAQSVIGIIAIAAIVAILYVILGKMGVAIPDWVVQIFWILVLAAVGILAVKFVMGLI